MSSNRNHIFEVELLLTTTIFSIIYVYFFYCFRQKVGTNFTLYELLFQFLLS